MIRNLALVQHVLFGALVVIGVWRSLATGTRPLVLGAVVALLLLWYAVGARRASAGPDGGPRLPDGGPRLLADGMRSPRVGPGGWWLLGLVVCWLVTVAVAPDLVWVAFCLWLLAGHLLPTRHGVAVSLLVLAVVVLRPWPDLTVAEVVGPAVGMVFALALSWGQQQLVRDGLERERLVTSLVAAQQETELLQAELAETHRAAGVQAERTRLSRDIHDTLAQGFSSILLLARAGAATDDAEAHRRFLGQIETSAAEHLDEARRVVGALAPAPLESGLADALRRIAARFTEETGVASEVRVEGDFNLDEAGGSGSGDAGGSNLAALPPVLEVALLRTAQAALANVRQHAQASRVVLTLADAGASVRLDVVDDGVGFDVREVGRRGAGREDLVGGGYGLRASDERLRELGGGLDLESTVGEGTAVSASVPLGGVA